MRSDRLFVAALLWATIATAGCGAPCDAATRCPMLDGYLVYYNGKLDPSKMCGVVAQGGGSHFHWDTPIGTCSCDVKDGGPIAGSISSTWTNCSFTPTMSMGQPQPDLSQGQPQRDMSSGAGSCVDITNLASNVQSIAADGSPATPTGGMIVDGLYRATALKVFGTQATAGTVLGAYKGTLQISGATIETLYDSLPSGSPAISFYGKGTFTATGGSVNVSFTCASAGAPASASFGYSVTSATTFDVTTQMPGYTTVATYSP